MSKTKATWKGPKTTERQEPLIPGVEPERCAEIEAAVDKFLAAKEAASSAAEEVKFAKECIVGEMKSRNITEYLGGAYTVTLDVKDEVKIKKPRARKSEGEE